MLFWSAQGRVQPGPSELYRVKDDDVWSVRAEADG